MHATTTDELIQRLQVARCPEDLFGENEPKIGNLPLIMKNYEVILEYDKGVDYMPTLKYLYRWCLELIRQNKYGTRPQYALETVLTVSSVVGAEKKFRLDIPAIGSTFFGRIDARKMSGFCLNDSIMAHDPIDDSDTCFTVRSNPRARVPYFEFKKKGIPSNILHLRASKFPVGTTLFVCTFAFTSPLDFVGSCARTGE